MATEGPTFDNQDQQCTRPSTFVTQYKDFSMNVPNFLEMTLANVAH